MPGACITAQVIKQRQGHVHPVYRYVGPGRAGSIPFVRDRAHACISVGGTGKGAYEIVTTEQPGSRDDLAGCGRAGWSGGCCRVSCHGQDGLVGVAWGRCDGEDEMRRNSWLGGGARRVVVVVVRVAGLVVLAEKGRGRETDGESHSEPQ